jgi:hypothetical protein
MTNPEGRPKPVVLASYENVAADRCVDLFQRQDGSFGFEEFRRDPEDGGVWTRVGRFRDQIYATRDEAVRAAQSAVAWLAAIAPDR